MYNDMSFTDEDKPNKQQWKSYLKIQKSGVTNMNIVNNVCDIACDLNRANCYYIMNHYEELEKEYELTIDDITQDDIRFIMRFYG